MTGFVQMGYILRTQKNIFSHPSLVEPHIFCGPHPPCILTNKFSIPRLKNLIKSSHRKAFILPQGAIYFCLQISYLKGKIF